MRIEEEIRAELKRIKKRIKDMKPDNELYQHTLGFRDGLKFALKEDR